MAKQEEKRFDQWSPLIPAVGQTVQLSFGNGVFIETKVISREAQRISEDRITFVIWVDWPRSSDPLALDITPNAVTHGMVDEANDLKSWWRSIPTGPNQKREFVKLFYLN